MLIKKVGEFGLIEKIRKSIKTDSSVIVGSGDDCAVLEFDKKNYQLFTCDMLVEGVDFIKKTPPYFIGRKALAVSISDIAACGGIPRHAVVSLGLPKNISLESVGKITRGMVDLARRFKINIVGGDISGSCALTIDVSMLGVVEKNKVVLRAGAKIGDIILVTGDLGGSIYGKHLKFIPRIKESRFLVNNYKIHSMIDISDGLTQDLSHILKAGKVGGVLYEELIPINDRAKNLQDALSGGEDFELLFTMSRPEAKKLLIKDSKNFKPVGEIVSKNSGFKLVKENGREFNIEPAGYRHF